MTRSLPGAEQAILGRLVVRQDDLETRLEKLSADVDRLTRATTALTDSVRRIPTPTTPQPTTSTTTAEEGQRDWLAVSEADVALAWLFDVIDWWEQVGSLLVSPAPVCWPWHPKAVVSALALQAQYREAYTGDRATPVSDLVTRWAPALGHLVAPRDSECNRHEHWQNSRPWSVRLDLLPEYATWWATDRTGHPPGLTPRQ